MLELIQAVPFAFAALFPVVNPIGSSIIFLTLANGSSRQELNKLSAKISIYVTVMLTVVLFIGSWILRLFGITLPIVLIGGGLVLAYIGWQLLNKPDAAPLSNGSGSAALDKDIDKMSFYPLTMPVTAGPGCIAVTIALGAHGVSSSLKITLLNQLGNSIGVLLVGVTVFFCYRYAYTITNKLGSSGMQVIMRLAAFINFCIGLELMWHGASYLL